MSAAEQQEEAALTQESLDSGDMQARSIKCADCGKMMANEALAQYHAEKSGHTNFEESTEAIKPLTEEERKQKLAELRAKVAAKRAVQDKEDSETRRANEKIRRKADVEMVEVREEMKRKEMLREAEKRKQEARADVEAKKRIREQIEADKRERAEKAARDKALREGRAAPEATTSVAGAGLTAVTAPSSASTSNQARLRVRCPDGTWTGTMDADATLQQLEDRLQEEGKASGPLTFSTSFPRKVMPDEDKSKTLRALGLVPNAALEASSRA